MKLIYGVKDKPKFGQLIIFAFQQLLAIMAATIAVPAIINSNESLINSGIVPNMSAAAAMFGAGVGTLVYQLFTKFRSPVFLGSSFAFIGSMCAAFAGATSSALGFLGLILGAVFAGLVYVVLALIVKLAGVNRINKLMPPAVIGSTVALIGLSLASASINDVFSYGPKDSNGSFIMSGALWASLACALVTLIVIICCSVYGKKMTRLIPFIIGILAGYAFALVLTVIGEYANIDAIKVIDFAPFKALVADGVGLSTFVAAPKFTFIDAIKGVGVLDASYIVTIAVAYVPVAFVVFAEHIADHKNLSSQNTPR